METGKRPLVKKYIPYRGILTQEQLTEGMEHFKKKIKENRENARKIGSGNKEDSIN